MSQAQLISHISDTFGEIAGNGHRPVTAPCASNADGQIAATFSDISGQNQDEKAFHMI
jgi:hypothetical protein